jgi:hypothetical protein
MRFEALYGRQRLESITVYSRSLLLFPRFSLRPLGKPMRLEGKFHDVSRMRAWRSTTQTRVLSSFAYDAAIPLLPAEARLGLRVQREGRHTGGVALNYVEACTLLRGSAGEAVGAQMIDGKRRLPHTGKAGRRDTRFPPLISNMCLKFLTPRDRT